MAAASGGHSSDSDDDDLVPRPPHEDDDDDDYDGLDDKSSDIKRAANECKIVFTDFLYRRLTSRRGIEDGDLEAVNISSLDTPSDTYPPDMDETERQQFQEVGNALAMFGDEIEDKYRTRFQQLLGNFNLEDTSSDFCFDKFRLVALRLLQHGENISMNWYRIVALLCFGYEMAIMYIRTRASDVTRFLKKIVTWVVRLMVNERIIEWIISQGGWFAGFIERLGDVRQNTTELWIKRVGALAVIAAVCFAGYRCFNGGKS